MPNPRRRARYGAAHRALRERWVPIVAVRGATCARCGKPILPGAPFDLDHEDGSDTKYRGVAHVHCNRNSAPSVGRKTSREW
jgi:hypothetical protein